MTGDPATQQWRLALGESTSARLRRAMHELGEMQDDRDLWKQAAETAQRERDELTRLLLDARQELAALDSAYGNDLEHVKRCAWRGLAVKAMQEADYARAQLDDLIATHAKETS